MLRRLAIAALLLLSLPAVARAQYFGQNKVNYSSFDFRIIRTEHFDVHYYPAEEKAALDVARMAERSYARLSRVTNHRFRERKVIILYASPSDFQQTNTQLGDIGEATGGFTDYFKQRNVIPLTGSYFDIDHVLTHEMVHQFQLDVFTDGGQGGIQAILAVSPPLWFMEGMAEYLSLGPINPETAMWLRDAVIDNRLPSIQQMTYDPRIFPYRFGHGLWSYIGERWGDEAVGAILTGVPAGGIEASFRRVLGVSLEQLSVQWRDAVSKRYLPEIGTKVRAASVAQPLLTKARSEGTYHLAPALSPDGSRVAYFSEKDFFSVDLYVADVPSGKGAKRLLKSSITSNYETFRFINSQANWSPDGQFLAFAAKRGPRDELLIVDARRNRTVRRIRVPLNGIATPSWSPDGRQLVFTGYNGGLSDLYVINADGSGMRQLTNDRHADLHPVWSPDGRTIAFTTDRGPGTDFEVLRYGNYRIALFDLESGGVRLLDQMDQGKNASPQWAPDGSALAFISDRTGVSNIFLYELAENRVYQLTDFYTGAQGITPLSPVLSWSRGADLLAFVYYEKDEYDVYTLANPRALKRAPFQYTPADSAANRGQLVAQTGPATATRADTTRPGVGPGLSYYRTPSGFRVAERLPNTPGAQRQAVPAPPPVSIARLLDSATFNLPDTSSFVFRGYRGKLSADYVARPTVGYVRDNFGQGVFGGSAIQLSDMLGNHQVGISAFVNGRIDESQLFAVYTNLKRRLNWATGVVQQPYFFFSNAFIEPGNPNTGTENLVTGFRRLVLRSAFVQAIYPFSRFQRLELGVSATAINDALRVRVLEFDPQSGLFTGNQDVQTRGLGNQSYVQPSIALVFDNTLFGYVGPFMGRRYRFEVGQALGGWRYTNLTADFRRYDRPLNGPVTLATRLTYFGRRGRDANQFPIFIGFPEFVRGFTSGSLSRKECTDPASYVNDPNSPNDGACAPLERLLGSQVLLGSAELRLPFLNRNLGLPQGIPPLELALFYDIGLAFYDNSTLRWSRRPGDDPINVRTPLQSWGASLRVNLFGALLARLDYARPFGRPQQRSIWLFSIGPTF